MASRIIPGDFIIKEITLSSLVSGNTIGLKFVFSELNFYESIFKNSVSGNLNITDSQNLISEFPIVGHEEIIISFGNPTDEESEDVEMKFRVYKISPYSRGGERTSEYTLHFITPEYYKSLQTRISKAYSNTKISDIVSLISQEYLEVDADVEITKGNHDILIPNWNPFDSLNWLSTRAQNPQTDGSNYVFYEDIEGYKFKSIESMMSQNVVEEYKWQPKNISELEEDSIIVPNDYTVENHFDMIKNIGLGMYSNKVLVHDIVKRSYEEITFDYLEDWNKTKHISNNPTISERVGEFSGIHNSFVKFIPKHDKLFNNKTNEVEKTILSRVSQIQQLNNFKINMVVPGNTKLNAGSMIHFELPSMMESDGGSTDTDRLYNGKYLISSCRHFINGDIHEVVLELLKDSFDQNLSG